MVGDKLFLLVDDVNYNCSFGYTDSKSKVSYNLKKLECFLANINLEERLVNSKEGLTTLFPLGRYIVTVELKNDKSAMKMWFIDFRTEYSAINKNFKGIFSEGITTRFKSLKYHMEEMYRDDDDLFLLDTVLEPQIE